ncbi:MAG: UDP-3-O-(3-hydroxymyristoyl)glucosamine N-acyltransferase [Bacteriovoracaceae bacterium]|nr:UDP-3-O-(3-hydroxymyristoyl)glucosamine N-acyltransferase [Bacteriovoracaceae bacterium]
MLVNELGKHDPSLEIIKGQDLNITRPADINSVEDNTLLFVGSKKFIESSLKAASEKKIAFVIDKKLYESLEEKIDDKVEALVLSSNVNISMSFLTKAFHEEMGQEENMAVDGRQMGTCDVHPTAWVAQGAFLGDKVQLGENVKIHSGAVLMGDISVGSNTQIFPNVTVYSNTKIGSNCRIHAGTVIGGDGFGYNFKDGEHLKVWHFGGVRIGNDVEIGANSCVDQGTFSPTIVGDGVKLDSQVMIAHNSKLGKGVIFCGQSGTAGSAVVGDYCVFGGKAGIAPGIELGPGSEVAGLGQVTSNFPAKSKIAGHPGRPIREWLRGIAWLRKQSNQ